MHWWQSLVLGILEGLTEYLPVSSTGHLILAQRAMGIGEGEGADAYAICIQAGAILAVLGLYFHRFKQMGRGLLGRDEGGRRLAYNLMVAFAITAVLGLALDHWIKEHLFRLWTVVAAWFVGGLAILVVSQWRPAGRRALQEAPLGGRPSVEPGQTPSASAELDQLTWRQAAVIGLIQALAMWPGTSRSLVTIVAGVLVGLGLGAAVEFSFLLGVITLTAATAHDLHKHGHAMMEQTGGWHALAIGTLSAAIAAVLAVEWMVSYLKRHGLSIFGWYRVALALVVAGLIVAGVLREAKPQAPGMALPAPMAQGSGR